MLLTSEQLRDNVMKERHFHSNSHDMSLAGRRQGCRYGSWWLVDGGSELRFEFRIED